MTNVNENPQKQNQIVLSHLNSLSPMQLVEDEKIANKFVQLYNNVHGAKTGELFYHKEKFNYMKMISENSELQKCTKLSLYGCFMDVAVNGLSFEQGSKPLAYVLTRNINTAPRNAEPVWEKRAYVQVSPYGELLMRMRAGQIKHADNPVIVYDGDVFEPVIIDGKKSVNYKMMLPHTGKKVVGAFIRITRMDGSVDFEWMTETDIIRLQGYSNRQNKGDSSSDKSNALYKSHHGGVDPGFMAAKMIKHAFHTYPKVRIGQFSELKSEEPTEIIDYGVPAAEISGAVKEESFSPAEEVTVQVTVVHDSEEATEAGF